MPIVDRLEELLPLGSSDVQVRVYECDDCDSTFESAKRPERAQCPECLSNEATVVGTAERD